MPMFSKLNNPDDFYVIAEVGQNHQGSVEKAITYIECFSRLGANAIKFQSRNNLTLFDSSVYDMPYSSTNSFGSTYGEHREALELSFDDFGQIKKACDETGCDLMITPFDEPSLDQSIRLGINLIKVASFDLGNLQFLDLIGRARLPTVMSTGGGNSEHIMASVKQLVKVNSDLAILHCVSQYPCPPESMRLLEVQRLQSEYPELTVGISDHFNGIISGALSYLLGARVFEKHVTFNRADKGTDHPFSLEPEGFRKFVRDIRRTRLMTSDSGSIGIGQETVFEKLGKSLIASRDIPKGTILSLVDFKSKIIKPQGIPVRDTYRLLGREVKSNLIVGQALNWCDICL